MFLSFLFVPVIGLRYCAENPPFIAGKRRKHLAESKVLITTSLSYAGIIRIRFEGSGKIPISADVHQHPLPFARHKGIIPIRAWLVNPIRARHIYIKFVFIR
jgi:hypothetical protein